MRAILKSAWCVFFHSWGWVLGRWTPSGTFGWERSVHCPCCDRTWTQAVDSIPEDPDRA